MSHFRIGRGKIEYPTNKVMFKHDVDHVPIERCTGVVIPNHALF